MQLGSAVVSLKDIVLLILGWLFGLVGPIVVWKIQTERKAVSVRAAVGYELAELKYRMVLAAYALNQDHGTFDRDFLNWVHTQVSSYRGANDSTRFLESLSLLLAGTDENLRQLSELGRSPTKGKSVPYARVPYLEAQLSELHIFSAADQISILQVL